MSAAVTMPAPRERPMIFSAPMIRALQAGTKTQTRRLAKFRPRAEGLNLLFSGLRAGHYHTGTPEQGWVLSSRDGAMLWNDRTYPLKCPHGNVGDRLWVKETWARLTGNGHRFVYRADGDPPMTCGGTEPVQNMKWTSPLFLPRSLSRFTLELTDVRVERLWDITEEDAKAEGLQCGHLFGNDAHRRSFAHLWDLLNAKRGFPWSANPWIWRISFRRVEVT